MGRETDRQIDKQTGRQTEKEWEAETKRDRDKQTKTEKVKTWMISIWQANQTVLQLPVCVDNLQSRSINNTNTMKQNNVKIHTERDQES